MNTVTSSVDQHSRRAINHISCSNLFIPFLKKIFNGNRGSDWRDASIYQKIVPTDAFTSILAEPSSGFISRTYLAYSPPSKITMSSSSYEAIPATMLRARNASFNFLFANRSSFVALHPECFHLHLLPKYRRGRLC